MKTAAKFCATALAVVLSAGLASVACAQTQGAGSIAVSDNPISTSVPGPSNAIPSTVVPAGSAQAASPAAASPIASSDVKEKKDASADKPKKKANKGQQNAVPDSVQDVVKRLEDNTQDVTLDDLNAAREAVVKLDVLIDIQKRMNDLAKLRGDNSNRMVAPIAAALPPAVADSVPVTPISASPSNSMPSIAIPSDMLPGASFTNIDLSAVVPPKVEEKQHLSALDVVRISGSSGDYSALIKDPSGKMKTVHRGDKLSDGTKIVSISREGVTIENGHEVKTIQVKNIVRVFSRG